MASRSGSPRTGSTYSAASRVIQQVRSFFTIGDAPPYSAFELKTLYLEEMFARGILIIGSHNMSYAHSDADVAALLAAYDEVLPILRAAVHQGDLLDRLHCEPLKPLFKVR